MKKVLELEFEDEIGKSFKVKILDPLEDLEEMQVLAAMNDILTNNIFLSNNTKLTRAVSARIIKTTIESMEF